MKRYIKSSVAALLVVVIFVATYVPIIAVGQPSSYSTNSNSGERDVICTTLDGTNALNYYKGANSYETLSNKTSAEILSSLRNLMKSTHTYNTTYDQCKNLASKTDCENNNDKVLLIYTSVTSTQSAANSGWNREHVWPKSLGGFETSGAGSDLHHIRPSDNRVNSCRNNLKYGNVTGGKDATGANAAAGVSGGTYNSTYFEPLDNVKGDVARICLYMYVRYGGESQYTCQSITKVFQSIDVLLEWCEMDPVDTWEMGRNEVVEQIQGNRNVFIDYPEYAWLIFGKEVPSDMQTPSGKAGEGSGSQGGATDTPHTHVYVDGKCSCGATDPNYKPTPSCTHKNTELKNSSEALCHKEGYTGDTYCKDCGVKLSSGNSIPAIGYHSFGDWVANTKGEYARHCLTCGYEEYLTVDVLFDDIDNEAEKILLLLIMGGSNSTLLDQLSQ